MRLLEACNSCSCDHWSEFLIQIGSCIGFWCGSAVFSPTHKGINASRLFSNWTIRSSETMKGRRSSWRTGLDRWLFGPHPRIQDHRWHFHKRFVWSGSNFSLCISSAFYAFHKSIIIPFSAFRFSSADWNVFIIRKPFRFLGSYFNYLCYCIITRFAWTYTKQISAHRVISVKIQILVKTTMGRSTLLAQTIAGVVCLKGLYAKNFNSDLWYLFLCKKFIKFCK